VKILDRELLADLSAQARRNPRRRQNYNLHASLDDPCQRLLNAMEPGSYIRPHRHLTLAKQEGFVGVGGRLAALVFDAQGRVLDVIVFGPREPVFGVDIPVGVWHTVVSLEPGSVFYETKTGPYVPIPPEDLAPWAPAEGSAEAGRYLDGLVRLAVEQKRGQSGSRHETDI
jgi:cupin fold WbuC family metalloprotein